MELRTCATLGRSRNIEGGNELSQDDSGVEKERTTSVTQAAEMMGYSPFLMLLLLWSLLLIPQIGPRKLADCRTQFTEGMVLANTRQYSRLLPKSSLPQANSAPS